MLWLCAPACLGGTIPKVGIMAVLLHSTAVRALVLAVILSFFAALTAPAARGATAGGIQQAVSANDSHTTISLPAASLLADEWSWAGFVKFWRSQAGSMTGVFGTVMLVGAGAVIMILYKGKG
jgi:hypothetical protein